VIRRCCGSSCYLDRDPAKQLLDAGTIGQAEFNHLKAKTLTYHQPQTYGCRSRKPGST
jgi:hypothetical protein